MRGHRFLSRLAALSLVPLSLTHAGPSAMPAQLKAGGSETRPESSGFTETSRYDDVVGFMRSVATGSPRIHLTTFGYSFEGRALPLAIVGNVKDASPESIMASGKTRIYIQGNIHAGEVEGKEALLELLRSIAAGDHASWLDSMVLLVAPIYNADGNERVILTNRPSQNGPVGGMGQRANAQNLDLNRDHVKLESPEARSFVALLNRYDPHMTIDLHTTDGTYHAYHLTYEPPQHPGTAPVVTHYLNEQLLPAVTREIKRQDGWDFFFYGNLPWRASEDVRGWYASDHLPRYNHNYVGLRNRLAILSEAYAYLTLESRIRVTRRFVEEILNFVQAHCDEIRRVTGEADSHSVVGEQLPVRAGYTKSPRSAEILLGEVTQERNPFTGATMLRRLDVKKPEVMPFFVFEPTETERAPRAYLIPSGLARVIERLEAHGIRSVRLGKTSVMKVERFRITSSTTESHPYQGHNERTLTGAWQAAELEIAAGTVMVPVDQPLGRLAFMLLEPRSDDSLATWNLLDDALGKAEQYPILRTSSDLPLPR